MFRGIFFRRTGKSFSLLFLLSARLVAAAELNVPGDYATIQAAIDAAVNGDSIVVEVGSYTENITLKSGVDVRGEEVARTFLEPEILDDAVVLADGIDDVLFGNITIINGQLGFDVINGTNLQVVNTVFDSITQVALQIDVDSQVDVLNCLFWNNVNAIRRGTAEAQITNVGFIGNVVTINSPISSVIDPNTNVDNCGFFDNEDLKDAGEDTGYGDLPIVGDPLFVATDDLDFHLQQDSPFIDTGLGQDSIDNTQADIGAYGGEFADARPFPVSAPAVTDVSGASPPPYSVELDWSANLAYLVTNTVMPGSYLVYYVQNQTGPPYDGTDAGNGTEPSPVDAGDNTTLTLNDLQPSAQPPDSPELLSAEPFSASVVVSWTAVSGASDYRVYYGVDSVDENQVDAGDVTSFTVTGLENGTEYLFSVSALAQSVYHFSITARDSTQDKNESVFSPESTLAIGALTEGMPSNVLTAIPDITTPYPDLPDKGCFVATAAFGADWSAEVQVLRDFRDRYLVTNQPGRSFVRWYYRYGPVAAAMISEFDYVRAVVRVLLWPAVIFALLILSAPPVAGVILLILSFALWAARKNITFRKCGVRTSE
jgi:hypothetical protein